VYLWARNSNMRVINFPENHQQQVGAVGDCPHCQVKEVYFRPVASYSEGVKLLASIARCEAYKSFVLVVGERFQPTNLWLSLRKWEN